MNEAILDVLSQLAEVEDPLPKPDINVVSIEANEISKAIEMGASFEELRKRTLDLAIVTLDSELPSRLLKFWDDFSYRDRNSEQEMLASRIGLRELIDESRVGDVKQPSTIGEVVSEFSNPFGNLVDWEKLRDCNALEAEGLVVRSRSEGSDEAGKTIIGPVCLKAKSGQLVALVGPNGVGKTTLMSALSGSILFQAGSLKHGIADSLPLPRAENLFSLKKLEQISSNKWSLRRRLCFVVGQPFNKPGDSLESTLHAYAAHGSLSKDQRRIAVKLIKSRYELFGFEDGQWGELSQGEQMRFLLACGAISRPLLLFLDEPLASLDELHRWKFLDDLSRLAHSPFWPATVVFTTHNISEAEAMCDQVLILSPKSKLDAHDQGSTLASREAALSSFKGTLFRVTVPASELPKVTNSFMEPLPRLMGRMLLMRGEASDSAYSIIKKLNDAKVQFQSVEDMSQSAARPQLERFLNDDNQSPGH
ncbi:MAG: ATP-binding cassette domain-containing protein [Pseudomonadota bacterium]